MNKCIFIGRITADPELKQTPSNISVCRFTVAVDRPYQKDKEKEADFIPCTAWRNTAEFLAKYFSKGSPILIEGSMRNNNYTDKDGVKHYAMDCLIDKVEFLPKNSDGGTSPSQQSKQQASDNSAAIADAIGDLGDFEEILRNGDVPF